MDTATINGSAAADTFTISRSSVALNGTTFSLTGIETWKAFGLVGNDGFTLTFGVAVTLDGGPGTDTVVGPDAVKTWHLTWTGKGAINGMVVFTTMETLTGGRNGTNYLKSSTVKNDTIPDTLTGGNGIDWFWANLSEITDPMTGEPIN